MKATLEQRLSAAVAAVLLDHELTVPDIALEHTRDPAHGDFTSNIAMRLAKPMRMAPRDLAAAFIERLPADPAVTKVEIAGPGFINFYLAADTGLAIVREILDAGAQFGRADARATPRYLVEYVSANPTGPLHVGHGRHAAYGASVAQLLLAAGYPVHQEYYVNDAGRQMEILAVSVLLRRLQQLSAAEPVALPRAAYQGDYIVAIAEALDSSYDSVDMARLYEGVPADSDESKDAHIDAIIDNAQAALGILGFSSLRRYALDAILADIRIDLAEFGVKPDAFFSEESLADDGSIDAALDKVREHGLLYEQGGATWFRATELGDEKDRVVVRDNGKKTYFASDIAYHYNKRERGFDQLLDILGSDHHGYVARVRAGMQAMGYDPASLDVSLVQFVSLFRGGEKQAMGTRSGKFVTLRALREAVGNDAARFFYIMRSNDQHLDFDMDLAVSKTNENPVYYIQYAHARVARVAEQLFEAGHVFKRDEGIANLALLEQPQEKALANALARYPELIQRAAEQRAPHALANYLREVATLFHSLYNAHRFVVDDSALRNARMALIFATQQVIRNGLGILGVSAPEKM
ncbi:MAG: arginine--tRNA ligase [Cyanobacteria bacterium P01_A01_bin.116]